MSDCQRKFSTTVFQYQSVSQRAFKRLLQRLRFGPLKYQLHGDQDSWDTILEHVHHGVDSNKTSTIDEPWLVVWNIFYFPRNIGNNHPN